MKFFIKIDKVKSCSLSSQDRALNKSLSKNYIQTGSFHWALLIHLDLHDLATVLGC